MDVSAGIYCAGCAFGILHDHEEGIKDVAWPTIGQMTWGPAWAVAVAKARLGKRRWRVRSIPVFRDGGRVGWRYWPEPTDNDGLPPLRDPHEVITMSYRPDGAGVTIGVDYGYA